MGKKYAGQMNRHLEDDGLTEGWLVVNPRASVTVSTGADFEVKGTVDFVLFCAEN